MPALEPITEKPEGWLAPGSAEAVDAGCICPIEDNAHGKGGYAPDDKEGWWLNALCPLHGGEWQGKEHVESDEKADI